MLAFSRTPSPLMRIAYVLALLALAQPLLAIVNPEVNGWRPDHAHVQVTRGPLAPHAHPSDHAAGDHEASSDPAVGFAAPDLDAGSALLPVSPALVLPEAISATAPHEFSPLAAVVIEADPPPPRA